MGKNLCAWDKYRYHCLCVESDRHDTLESRDGLVKRLRLMFILPPVYAYAPFVLWKLVSCRFHRLAHVVKARGIPSGTFQTPIAKVYYPTAGGKIRSRVEVLST